jgi:hypothetical protein
MTREPDECGESAYTEDHCYVHDSPWPAGHQHCFEMQERIMRQQDRQAVEKIKDATNAYRHLVQAMRGGNV